MKLQKKIKEKMPVKEKNPGKNARLGKKIKFGTGSSKSSSTKSLSDIHLKKTTAQVLDATAGAMQAAADVVEAAGGVPAQPKRRKTTTSAYDFTGVNTKSFLY